MARPKLLLIDELSLGLAPKVVDEICVALERINRGDTSIMLVEQDVMTALDLAARGFVLDVGRIFEAGASKDLIGSPRVQQAFFGVA